MRQETQGIDYTDMASRTAALLPAGAGAATTAPAAAPPGAGELHGTAQQQLSIHLSLARSRNLLCQENLSTRSGGGNGSGGRAGNDAGDDAGLGWW